MEDLKRQEQEKEKQLFNEKFREVQEVSNRL